MNFFRKAKPEELNLDKKYPLLDEYISKGEKEIPVAVFYVAKNEPTIEIGLLHGANKSGINFGFRSGFHLIEWEKDYYAGDVTGIAKLALIDESKNPSSINRNNISEYLKKNPILYKNESIRFNKSDASLTNHYHHK